MVKKNYAKRNNAEDITILCGFNQTHSRSGERWLGDVRRKKDDMDIKDKELNDEEREENRKKWKKKMREERVNTGRMTPTEAKRAISM